MLSTPKAKELFLASSLRDGLEDNNINQVTTLLQNKEADPNVLLPMHGLTPFHLVIGNESETFAKEVTKLFLRHGGDPNVRSVDGMTPVHVAAAWGRVQVLELLLENGGDPLCVDRHHQNPIHYALDGCHYEAVTLLGKYCMKRQEGEEDCDESGTPKIQIKLEKILVNKGDVVAEYVPSEIDLTDDSRISSTTQGPNSETPTSETQESITTSTDSTSALHSNNITLRRYQAFKSRQNGPILSERAFNIEFKERSHEEEKVLIGEIITRISDSFNKAEKEDLNQRKKENTKIEKKKFSSLLPQPKYFKRNLKTPTSRNKIFPSYLDSSIISTSPNFRVGNLNREETPPNQHNSGKLRSSCTPKNFQSPSVVTPKIRSASSTPKRKIVSSKVSHGKKGSAKIDKTPLNKTYQKSGILPFSPDTEDNLKAVKRRLISREIAKKLEKSYDEDLVEKPQDVKEKTPKNKTTKYFNLSPLNNNPEVESPKNNNKLKLCNTPLNKLGNTRIIKSPATPNVIEREHTLGLNIPVTSEDRKKQYFESPGSSNPRSLTSSPKRESTGEELKLWREIDEIYNKMEQTPPASVSGAVNDPDICDTLNPPETSSTTEATFYSNSENLCEENLKSDLTKTSEEDLDAFKTPVRSTISSRYSMESFFSVDEEYAYVDSEKKVAFVERRLRVLSPTQVEDMNNVKNESTWLDMLERLSLGSASSVPSSAGGLANLQLDHYSLRCRLMALGEAPGPITHSTFNVYLKRLRKLERTVKLERPCVAPSSPEQPDENLRPKSIPKTLLVTDWTTKIQQYREIEHEVFQEYHKMSFGRNYRGGIARVSFNYLLLDPRITNDLPRTGGSLSISERWKIFLEAIFYIGKGKSARPAAHLYEAFDTWTGKKRNDRPSEKLQRIMNIWRNGKGVVSLQVFSNSMQEEAFTREAAMIDTLGTSNLSNCNRGQYYGEATKMSMEKKKLLGKYLLYKAMEIFMHEGERQLFPKNVE